MYNANNMKSLEETIVDDADSDAAPYHNQNKNIKYPKHSCVLSEDGYAFCCLFPTMGRSGHVRD